MIKRMAGNQYMDWSKMNGEMNRMGMDMNGYMGDIMNVMDMKGNNGYIGGFN